MCPFYEHGSYFDKNDIQIRWKITDKLILITGKIFNSNLLVFESDVKRLARAKMQSGILYVCDQFLGIEHNMSICSYNGHTQV